MFMSRVRAPIHKSPRIYVTLLSLTACVLVLLSGCGKATASVPAPTSTTAQPTMIDTSQPFVPPSSLDELIFISDVIAWVRLIEAQPGTEWINYTDNPGDLPIFEFRFQAIEYLKGSGDNEFMVKVPVVKWQVSDRDSAESLAEDAFDARDRSWDNREALVFLRAEPVLYGLPPVTGASDQTTYQFIGPGFNEYPVDIHEYAIMSSYNRAWLPSSAPNGASGAVGSVEPEYFTEAPPSQSQGAAGVVSASAPTISLSEIKRRIKANDDLLTANRDVPGYEECIEWKLRHDAEIQSGHIRAFSVDASIPSGRSEGHRLSSKYAESQYYSKWWTTGPDSDLFILRMVEDPDNDPSTGYEWEHVTTRPIPRGVYRVFYSVQSAPWVPCNYNPDESTDDLKDRREIVVVATAPPGTLHEAFFDPMDIGSAVGSDTDNGVLDPTSFTLEGVGSVNINRIDWKLGKVEVELDPHSASGFANHHIDFIALDGSVTLRLDLNDAAEVEQDGTRALAWNVCAQPWESGDLLMLRMSESGEDLIGVTNNGPCSPPAPRNLAATSTHDSVTLTWDAPDGAAPTGYRILRRQPSQDTFIEVEVAADVTTYVDTTDIQPGTKYIYRVHAVYPAGVSEVARVTGTTLAGP